MPSNPQSHHHHATAKRNLNLKILTFILKTTIMLVVISSFLLFLSIAALHLLLLSRRRPSAAHGGAISPENLLPEFIYNGSEEEDWSCAVCLEGYRDGDTCTRLPGCCHVYHSLCVDTWLAKVPNCPVCRTRVRLHGDQGCHSSLDASKVFWSL